MFPALSKRRSPRALQVAAKRRELRRSHFEMLEDRRVLAADSVAIGAFVNMDPFGFYQQGDPVFLDFGFEAVNTASITTVKMELYENPDGDFAPDIVETETHDHEIYETLFAELFSDEIAVPADATETYEQWSFQFTAPAAGSYFVVLTVYDNEGNVARFASGMPLEVQPSLGMEAAITEPIGGALVPGGSASITAAATGGTLFYDFTFQVFRDTNNDGLFDDETPVVISGTHMAFDPSETINFPLTAEGNYKVVFTAGFGSETATDEAYFSVGATHLDEVTGVLSVGASAGGSTIVIGAAHPSLLSTDSVSVAVDGVTTSIDNVAQIVVYGSASSDIVLIDSSVTTSVWVFGGAGNDLIVGGSGDDVIVGGGGVDIILGGAGRDIIIGGRGNDVLSGNGGEDILIAGYTAFDDDASTLATIASIWTSANSLGDRLASLRDGLLVTGAANPLDNTVFDDDALDILTGDGGTDWYFANLVRDQGESILNLDLVVGTNSTERSELEELINELLS
jgi:hypothetical protein